MNLTLGLVVIYLLIGAGMAGWDFRSSNGLHEQPRFIHDRSVSTAIIFIFLWPYKLLKKH